MMQSNVQQGQYGQSQGLAGNVPFILRIIEARGLKKTDITGKCDPYTVIKFKKSLVGSLMHHDVKLMTRVVEKNQNPIWNEEFVLHPSKPDTDIIQIQMFDKDRIGADTFLGKVNLPVAQYYRRGLIDEWIPLSSKRKLNKPAFGEIHILVNYNEGMGMGGQTGSQQQGWQQQQQGYGQQPYGTPGYGSSGYGSSGYGSSGYGTSGTSGYGTSGYGTSGYGTSGYGTSGYGSSGYGSGLSSTSGYGTSGYGTKDLGTSSGLGSSGYSSGYGLGSSSGQYAPVSSGYGSSHLGYPSSSSGLGSQASGYGLGGSSSMVNYPPPVARHVDKF
jgi:hypothetical protein